MKGVDDAAGAGLAGRASQPALVAQPHAATLEIEPVHPRERLTALAANAGLHRVEIVAWRDLDHPEAGGSEVHAARIAERWAAAGIDVHLTTSRAPGAPRCSEQDGYRTTRPAGRYSIFPVVAAAGWARGPAGSLGGADDTAGAPGPGRRRGRPDGVVEIWNGMPFFSPLWAPHPRVVFLHHVHGAMWDLVLPPHLARAGRWIEQRLAPPLYRRTPIVTLSESSRSTIVASLGLPASRVSVVPPGVDDRFRPGGRLAANPTVVAVGRLVPYKRFDLLIDVLAQVRRRHPDLRAVVAGEGAGRDRLEALVAAHHAEDWLHLPGRVSDDSLVDLYRRAWVVVSTSAYEGWGLTISEAAACGTPAVASPIDGHLDAVEDGRSGLLAEPGPDMVAAVDRVLTDQIVRRRLRTGAQARAQALSWDRTALETLRVLAGDRPTLPGPPRTGGA